MRFLGYVFRKGGLENLVLTGRIEGKGAEEGGRFWTSSCKNGWESEELIELISRVGSYFMGPMTESCGAL